METVRAKFRLDEVRSSIMHRYETQPDGTSKTVPRELRTLVFNPVSKGTSPENDLFWQYTPSGRVELGTINPEAWAQFELGKEYYLDFAPAS